MRKNKVGRQKNGFSMFILDDDENMTDALEAYFEASGYEVESENHPLQALDRLEKKSFDILLLDFIMYPICGDEVVERLRKFDEKIYVIMLTGHREVAPPLNTIRELEIQGYFEKSDRFDQLELLVESCIKSIRQMKIVSGYQNGLSKILEAIPSIHRFLPLDEFAEQAVEQLAGLTGAESVFIWLNVENFLNREEEKDLEKEIFIGKGSWKGENRSSMEQQNPRFKTCLMRRNISICEESDPNTLLIPLKGADETRYGVMGLSAEEGELPEKELLEVFSDQIVSALRNLILHRMLQKNNQYLQAAYTQLENSYVDTVKALRLLVDAKDIYTRGHSDRVSYYAVKIAEAMGKSEWYTERVRDAGLLHDIGKIGVSDAILRKPEKLLDEEYEAVKKHPEIGADILSKITMFQELADIIGAHHERYDGSGYPKKMAGKDIPEEARIISIADAFDAMMSDRSYRKKRTLDETIEELKAGKGKQFDSEFVDVFLTVLEDFEEMDKELQWTYLEG